MKNIVRRITDYNAGRLPEFLTIKYKLLRADPFRFFRGTCHIFYEDLAKGATWADPSRCWITGDLHLENFGTYKGNDKVVYFDMNDFDEACFAPASWELVRLLSSIHIAARVLQIDEAAATALCKVCTETYIATLLRGKPWVIDKGTTSGVLHYLIANLQGRKRSDFIKARTVKDNEGIKLKIDHAKTFPIKQTVAERIIQSEKELLKGCPQLTGYRVTDSAFRVAGTGSVGLERYVLLLQHEETGKLRLVDMKEAGASSVVPWLSLPQPHFRNESERITTVQHYVQHVAPSLLQAVKMGGKHYVLKALQPTQDRVDLELCKKKPGQLEYMVSTMARLTASGQLRSGGRMGSSITDELIDFAKNAKAWQAPVNNYAKAYAAKVEADYKEFCAADIK